ncbi:glycine--tRNA ligase [Calycomorphotria hydatis]|uniref:Glycine--tRNA ligase n=1 Tax=Calycomorphotria hydatis TaxID=2528027 RepID=A0A517T9A1_9PLAN|nr:glycine--tRNA ligase [Calycomorphotria hydatis]QDT64965.1 Glycine--tRNA ligase [Calycomorphotria hydatis]
MSEKSMEQIVSLCKRRGLIFQDSDIYGGQNGFWDYGPLGVLLKRNVRETWWQDMVATHDELTQPETAPSAFSMVGVETSIIMHPQVWKCSGHYDLFHDMMVDCRETKGRYRFDHVVGRYAIANKAPGDGSAAKEGKKYFITISGSFDDTEDALIQRALEFFKLKKKYADTIAWEGEITPLSDAVKSDEFDWANTVGPEAKAVGTLTEPREFNLMFKTTLGALGGEDDAAFLRPETAQGIFVNFKNILDSSRVKLPFGVAQVGKSFRNEITPRNFTFRSREFEQMEIEFFCHPSQSSDWYQYWRERRFAWYKNLGISEENLILREHLPEELAHYSIGTADIEYAFPFLDKGEYGELEGVAHRGNFDLRSHMEGKLVEDKATKELVLELGADGKPKHRGSGKDLMYFDDQTRERFVPHVIEPSAGADRATLAFICEAYAEDEAPDEKGNMQTRTLMRFHPRIAPIKAAVLPLIKKEGMPEKAADIYRSLKKAGLETFYDVAGAIGRRYRRQDEVGTPYCITVDGDTMTDDTVTVRDRDSLEQYRVPIAELSDHLKERIQA